ncbi:MAG: hypothetical protein N2D54_04970, partial [Chloroflexota bacterium]
MNNRKFTFWLVIFIFGLVGCGNTNQPVPVVMNSKGSPAHLALPTSQPSTPVILETPTLAVTKSVGLSTRTQYKLEVVLDDTRNELVVSETILYTNLTGQA